jgi:hypothetical protein
VEMATLERSVALCRREHQMELTGLISVLTAYDRAILFEIIYRIKISFGFRAGARS